MKVFILDKWKLQVSPEAWGYPRFKKILLRDKSDSKEIALKEMLFIYHFCDIESDYSSTLDNEERELSIRKDLLFNKSWKIDKVIKEAITFYNKRSDTIIERLYRSSVASADAIGGYLARTEELLNERDSHGKVVNDISKIKSVLKDVPVIMKNLNHAYEEVVAGRKDTQGKKKGSQSFNTFEEGLDFEDK